MPVPMKSVVDGDSILFQEHGNRTLAKLAKGVCSRNMRFAITLTRRITRTYQGLATNRTFPWMLDEWYVAGAWIKSLCRK